MGRGKRAMRTHDQITEVVFDRLCGNGYGIVTKNREYTISEGDREFDVLAIKVNNDHINYAIIIEVKTNKHGRSSKKARSQLEKGCKAVRMLYGRNVRCFKLFVYQDKAKYHNEDPNWDRKLKPYLVEWFR